jgi:SAM-dependent methyltransferase
VHEQSATVPPKPAPALLERIRLHLAWKTGAVGARPIDARLIHSIVGRAGATIAVAGSNLQDLPARLGDLGHQVIHLAFEDNSWNRARESGSPERVAEALPKRSFDAVVLMQFLQRCREPRRALQDAHRLLVPEGVVLVEVPNNASYAARRFGASWYLCDAGRHLSFFTAESLGRLFHESGYHVKDTLYRQYVPQFQSSRLVLEQEIWDRLYANRERAPDRLPRRKSRADLWTGIIATMFEQPAQKYEILAVVGAAAEGS